MTGSKILKKPAPRKISNSNILRKIIYCLENNLFTHMLYWDDKKKKEFIIKFVHKNNPKWNATYLDLFKELDKLSNKYKEYLKEKNYEERCKGRCKSNLAKLCGKNNGALTFIREIKEGKSIRLMKYKLNENVLSNVRSPDSKGEKMTEKKNVNGLSDCETDKYDKTYGDNKLEVVSLPNKPSDYLCLSNFHKIIYVAMPIGATTISCESPIGSLLLNRSCSVESRNEDTRNVILQLYPLTVYEHEKQMDETAGSSPTICAESVIPNSNNLAEAMSAQDVTTVQYTSSGYNEYHYSKNLRNKIQDDPSPTICAESVIPNSNNLAEVMSAQDVTTMQYTPSRYNGYQYSNKQANESLADSLPTICTENIISNCNNFIEAMSTQNAATVQSTPSEIDGYQYNNNIPNEFQVGSPICAESVISNSSNLVEVMSTQNEANLPYTPSGYNEFQYSNSPPNGFQNGDLQVLNVECKNCSQEVPSSPLEYPSDDPISDWDMDDISKPLQGDYDPFLSSTISYSSSNNLLEENSCLPSDLEAWYSFENSFN